MWAIEQFNPGGTILAHTNNPMRVFIRLTAAVKPQQVRRSV